MTTIFTVDSTSDAVDSTDTVVTLREAIIAANADNDADIIKFLVPETDAGYDANTKVWTIRPLAELPAITNPVVIDGYTQSGASPNTLGIGPESPGHENGDGTNAVIKIELDGSNLGDGGLGLVLDASGSTVQGLAINRFRAAALWVLGDNSTIAGNFIGTDPTGTLARPNSEGPRFDPLMMEAAIVVNSDNNLVGGTTPAARNLISGNAANGILIQGSQDLGHVVGNRIEGNLIGTDATGILPLGNATDGIEVAGYARNFTIGGTAPGARNIISASRGIRPTGQGWHVSGSGVNLEGDWYPNVYPSGILLQGNFIGTDVSGTLPLPNGYGVSMWGSSDLTVGGIAPGAGNLISGNLYGLVIGPLAAHVRVQGNYIGTDVTGTLPLGNGVGIATGRVLDVLIGGTELGAGNVIAGNNDGLDLGGAYPPEQDDQLLNLFGDYRYPGGATTVQGNFIGTDRTGTQALGGRISGYAGIRLRDGAGYNLIGGTAPEARNIISGHWSGLFLYHASTAHNIVQGNYIGSDVTGTKDLGNSYGIYLGDAINNTIGGTEAGAGNLIAFNAVGVGVSTWGGFGGAVGATIRGNSIHSNELLGIDLFPGQENPDGPTPNDSGDGDSGANNYQNFPVLTSVLYGASTTVTGTLNSTPDSTFFLDFYANSAVDASGYGEGDRYLGSATVTTDSSGDITFDVPNLGETTAGEFITATATAEDGSTSEFSPALPMPPLVVTNTWDAGPGSLRQALLDANARRFPVTIQFEIPQTDEGFIDVDKDLPGGDDAKDAFVIQPLSPLPAISNPHVAVTIDGRTQAAFGGDTNPFGPEIVLDGSLFWGDGLVVYSSDNSILGLNIAHFAHNGVFIAGAGAGDNVVAGNYIGTDATGTAAAANGNGIEIQVASAGNVVGGTAPGMGNVISGNADVGIMVGQTVDAAILGNRIGTDATGTHALGNAGTGVSVGWAANVRVGGSEAGAANVISANGVGMTIGAASHIRVQGNMIGTDVSGTTIVDANGRLLGNGLGIYSFGQDDVDILIGGDHESARNVISGNYIGLSLDGTSTTVLGNYIGTNRSGTAALGNVYGIMLRGRENVVGGTTAGTGNVVSGSFYRAIELNGAHDNVIQGNLIGTDPSGQPSSMPGITRSWGEPWDDGIASVTGLGNAESIWLLYDSIDNQIGGREPGAGNVIAHNLSGVVVTSYSPAVAHGNSIVGNAIYANGPYFAELGIDLGPHGVTPNDPGDEDAGDNGLQNFPILISAHGGTSTRITGMLNSTPNTTFTLDFYANEELDPSGYGEGQRWLGWTVVETGVDGNASFAVVLSVASGDFQYFTATATAPDGSTSEFSLALLAEIVNSPPVADPDVAVVAEDESVTIDVLDNDSDADGDSLAIADYTLPANGALTLNPDGTFLYVPAANFNGSDSFTYVATDGQANSNTATVTIVVNPANDVPVASPLSLTVAEDASVVVTLHGDDIETAELYLVFTITALPAQGGVTDTEGNEVVVGQQFVGSPVLVYERGPACEGAAQVELQFTVTDRGDPDSSSGVGATSAAAIVDIGIVQAVADGQVVLGADGIVRVGGTTGNDVIFVSHTICGGKLLVFINGVVVSNSIPRSQVQEVRVWGRSGHDIIELFDLAIMSYLHGGTGNDIVSGAAGNDLIFGGEGCDLIAGAGGNDFLVGGDGVDVLFGGAGHDILVSGDVSCRLTIADLRNVSAVWVATKDPDTEATEELVDEALGDDDFDFLTGGSGADWFIVGRGDRVMDFKIRNKDGDLVTIV